MLTLLLGTDWTANRTAIFKLIAEDVAQKKPNRILIVPELISHESERRLCDTAGPTASRFAEVLSFTRLCRRVSEISGHGTPECMDDGGRVVAMASAIDQVRSKLKYYAAVSTKPEFLTGLVDAVDEFKRCCISSRDLLIASEKTDGSFAQKLEELSLILEAYDTVSAAGRIDPRDQMTWLLGELESCDYAKDHIFYIDCFPDFTRQHMAILEHLIVTSSNVTVSLNCDIPSSDHVAFEKAGETAYELIRAAKQAGVEYQIIRIDASCHPLKEVALNLFEGDLPMCADHIKVAQYDSAYQECAAAAEYVRNLVQAGCRYRDINIVCADMPGYRNALEMIFGRCSIPSYISGTECVLDMPVVATIISALDAATGGFAQEDVFHYMKTMFSPVELEESDSVENYAILWGITGSAWTKDWDKHPDGLDGIHNEKSAAKLHALNSIRKVIMEPLVQLQKAFYASKTVSDQVLGLYHFLEQIRLAERLQATSEEMDREGDSRNAQILNQLWEILIGALEQLHDSIGGFVWNQDVFSRLLKLLLSQYSVGTIPAVLDAVTVGPVSAMRCQEPKHLIVLGANEGLLPSYGSSAGVFSDQERIALRAMGVPLTGGASDGMQIEFSEIYGVFCGVSQSIFVSCCGGQPSFVYKRLEGVSDGMDELCGLGPVMFNKMEAASFLARSNNISAAKALSVEELYSMVQVRKNFELGTVSEKNVRRLYGETLRLSASQIDKHADCKMAYFLHYGLKAKERKPASVDPAEFGTYVHYVLEKTAQRIVDMGGFKKVSKDESLKIAAGFSSEYIAERFTNLDSQRTAYLFKRNEQELTLIVEELYDELHNSRFNPVLFEFAFGDMEGNVPAIPISGARIPASIRGFVDRIDAWEHNGSCYYRVVDYKTGKKDFDYCDVFNGLGLQMLLYLFALEHTNTDALGDEPHPAGVQYFPARVPVIPADGILDDESAAVERVKNWKRKGLLLNDADVLHAMEPEEKPVRLSVTVKKDGIISGDVASAEQFSLLREYIFKLLRSMVDDIASGIVTANPYTRGSSHNPCWYCPFGSVCHQTELAQRRNYERMTAQRFWNEIRREMNADG